MGQGYSMTTLSAASASIDVPELADLVYEKTLASSRFMKSIRARSQQGFVFVKAIMKPYSTFSVHKYVKQITEERDALANVPNALGYQRIVEVTSGGFLVRQYMFSSVYDRLSTRPFLEDIEKKWLTFQLLCAVRDCHSRNIFHGDIKTENLLVTSWNWLFLTDFSASFKPTFLPEDNPADFSFYFDTSGRRTCYLAPERFSESAINGSDTGINWAMDIFSVGCVVAEIFLEGPIFTLSQIFKYRTGDYSPEHTHINQIEDTNVREMLLNMIDLDPEKRYSAEQYLSFYRGKLFPEYFYNFLHQYMLDLTDPLSGRKHTILDLNNLDESDDKIDRVHFDLDKISYFLGYSKKTNPTLDPTSNTRGKTQDNDQARDSNLYDGTLLFLNIVVSSVRNTSKVSARLKACDLLVEFAERLPDEAKLDRILPYIAGLLGDPSDIVKTVALRAMSSILENVQVVSPINAYIFPEYIFPKLRHFVLSTNTHPSPLVRATYASCVASLALSSARILDMVQAIRADGRLPTMADENWSPETMYNGLYDVARSDLVPYFEEATKALITDPDASVRRAFLGSVARLCIFFGSAKSSDVILSHLNTYLNDKDWILKCTFYDALVGVAAYVGSAVLEKFILPLMVQSLTDSENIVVEKVFRSLARMSALGLIGKSTSWNLVSIGARFLVHPSTWIRESAAEFIAMSTKYASTADKYCIVLPILAPFLKAAITECSEFEILDHLKKPITRAVFDMAISWAAKPGESLFWGAAAQTTDFILPEPDKPRTISAYNRKLTTRIPASQRSKEDDLRLDTLRNLGMTADEEMKLMALREYISRSTLRKSEVNPKQQMLANILPLTEINVTPQNVFFDTQDPVREIRSNRSQSASGANREHHTIADALLDASSATQGHEYRQSSKSTTEEHVVSQPRQVGTQQTTTAESSTSPAIPSSLSSDTAINGTSRDRNSSVVNDRSPNISDKPSFKTNPSLALRHRNSAMNLMNRNDMAKADAAVSTNSENAFGRLDGPAFTRRPTEASPLALAGRYQSDRKRSNQSSASRYAPNHSYTGNDPNVLRLLDYHFSENFPTDLLDFGSTHRPTTRKAHIRHATDPMPTANAATSDNANYTSEPWRPSGHLLTIFSEHTAAINKVNATSDDSFFVTASDDGSCKIWDSTRLEKNITPRSRHTHRHAQGAKVKSLCFVEDTYTFICAADNGSIHAVRVDHRTTDDGENMRYSKPTVVRDYTLPQVNNIPEYAIDLLHHRNSNSQSIVLAATNHCRIHAIDLKSTILSVIYTLSNPLHHGTPTAFVMDPKQQWLLLGTDHGVLDLWDLRFQVHLRSFALASCMRIDALVNHPSKIHTKWILLSSGGELSAWDVEKLVCKEVYRTNSMVNSTATTSSKSYEPWFPDDEPTEKMLERFGQDLQVDQGGRLLDPMSSTSPLTRNYLAITSIAVASDYVQKKGSSTTGTEPERVPIVITAGADRALRYWDMLKLESSKLISGPMLDNTEEVSDIGRKITYEVSYPLSVSAGAQIMVVQEYGPGGNISSAKSTPSKRGSRRDVTKGSESLASTSTGVSERVKPPRNTVISAAQQQLLKTHMHGITDALILKRPYGLVVSVDSGGNIFVFQ